MDFHVAFNIGRLSHELPGAFFHILKSLVLSRLPGKVYTTAA